MHVFSGTCLFQMASAGEEFNVYQRALYLWNVYIRTYYLCVYMFIYCVFQIQTNFSGSCNTNIFPQINIKITLPLPLYFFTNTAEDAQIF
jgi:hypothetical protein